MPPPQTNFFATTDKSGYDPATLSDEEDGASEYSHSTWASSSNATILGFADGFVGLGGSELTDWKVSRIGGLPTFPLAVAPDQSTTSTCQSCHLAMPLLTQIYCPLESSSLERVVYVFACPRSKCRKRDGSVRAFRANRVWNESVEEKQRVEEEKKEKEGSKAVKVDLGGLVFGNNSGATTTSSNPFATTSNPFAPATAIPSSNPFESSTTTPSPLNPFASTAPPPVAVEDSHDETVSQMAQTTPSSSSWSEGPSYPPQYVTTSYEPSSPVSSSKNLPPMAKLKISDPLSDDPDLSDDEEPIGHHHHRAGKGSGGRTKKGSGGGKGRADGSGGGKSSSSMGTAGTGPGEGYEVQKVKGVDEIFLRFQERVSREGLQVIRYDHGTQPLPFSASSTAYKTMFPPATPHSTSIPAASSSDLGQYEPRRAPTCRSCGKPSTFEYQLMPNLISLLNKADGLNGLSAFGEHGRESGRGGGGKKGIEVDEGLDWATVWVFTCERECVESRKDKETWREERVLVEWEE